ncbi:hypothetical protein GCM10023224_46450 [Streptomonospora halophila]|uniref:Uncharacterized protein n=1 Tax=Streptomonospora halophila TaxID=427369 RepID=A0ABP9GWR3_9ACTN
MESGLGAAEPPEPPPHPDANSASAAAAAAATVLDRREPDVPDMGFPSASTLDPTTIAARTDHRATPVRIPDPPESPPLRAASRNALPFGGGEQEVPVPPAFGVPHFGPRSRRSSGFHAVPATGGPTGARALARRDRPRAVLGGCGGGGVRRSAAAGTLV